MFEPELEHPEHERLTDRGKVHVDSAIAPYLEHVASGIVIVEGYAQEGPRDEQYLRSRARASIVRDYLICDVCRHYRVGTVGRTSAVRERYYAISAERRIEHPGVAAVTSAARTKVFG